MPRVSSAGLLSSLVLVVSGVSWSQDSLAARTVPDRAHWFNYPQILCRALDAQGFVAGAWAPVDTQSPVYRCSYPPSSRQADIPALIAQAEANQRQQPPPDLGFEVSFEVSGDHKTTADSLSLAITITGPESKAEAKKHFLVYIRGVFQAIGYPMPAPLPAYLEREEHYLAHQPYGIVSLFTTFRRAGVPKPDVPVLWLRLGRSR